jgi:MATE family multidrug resistance protein
MNNQFELVKREFFIILSLVKSQLGVRLLDALATSVDTLYFGALGTDALAAGGNGALLLGLLVTIISDYFSVLSTEISSLRAHHDSQQITRIASQFMAITVLFSIPSIAILASSHFLFRNFLETSIAQSAWYYALAVAIGMPAIVLFVLNSQLLLGISRPKAAGIISAFGIGLNAVFNYLAAYKWGLGVAGIGLSTSLCYMSMTLLIEVYLFWKRPVPNRRLECDWVLIGEILRLGRPLGIMAVFEFGQLFFTSLMAGIFGTAAAAAHTLASQINLIVFRILACIADVAGMRLAIYIAQNNASLRIVGIAAIAMEIVPATCVFVLFRFFPFLPMLPFQPSQEVGNITASILGVVAVFHFFDGTQSVFRHLNKAFRDNVATMWISVFSFCCVSLGSAYAYAFVARLGVVGLWMGIGTGLFVGCVAYGFRYWQLTSHFLGE